MFFIRADGNSEIGMGHIMRCLSIADAVKEQGTNPVFITSCKECIPVIEQRGYQTRLLSTDYREMLSELSQLVIILREFSDTKNLLLVDSYQVSEKYFKELGKFVVTACLEDMGQSYPVDVLINYNIYGEKLSSYYLESINSRPHRMLLGTAYAPLRLEFQQGITYTLREKVTDVMITTGGGDTFFATRAFIESFLADERLQKRQIRYHIISGPFNIHAADLKKLYANNSNIVIHENVKNMKEIMQQSDVVLTATGSTIYEVSALGVPMIAFYFVENQRQGAEEISKKTHVINCGDFQKEPENVVKKATDSLFRCVNEKDYRELLHREEKQLVDGQGAHRIAAALLSLLHA